MDLDLDLGFGADLDSDCLLEWRLDLLLERLVDLLLDSDLLLEVGVLLDLGLLLESLLGWLLEWGRAHQLACNLPAARQFSSSCTDANANANAIRRRYVPASSHAI